MVLKIRISFSRAYKQRAHYKSDYKIISDQMLYFIDGRFEETFYNIFQEDFEIIGHWCITAELKINLDNETKKYWTSGWDNII